jgi:hypothetical protein
MPSQLASVPFLPLFELPLTHLVMMGTMSTRAHDSSNSSPPIPNRFVEVKSRQPATQTSPSTFALEVRMSARMMSEKGTGEYSGERIVRRRDLQEWVQQSDSTSFVRGGGDATWRANHASSAQAHLRNIIRSFLKRIFHGATAIAPTPSATNVGTTRHLTISPGSPPVIFKNTLHPTTVHANPSPARL